MNFNTVAFHAQRMLERWQPDALVRPEVVHLARLLDDGEATLGVSFRRCDVDELGADEGGFCSDSMCILLREDHWDALLDGTPGDDLFRARSTVAHELGHFGLDGLTASEEAAWAFAGCLLMPPEIVVGLDQIDDQMCSRVFNVSPQLAGKHLRRMKRARLL